MVVLDLLGWWYSQGWAWIFSELKRRLTDISESFSVGILLRTLFSPWKQIQSPVSFRNFLQSKLDNFISRFIGATVRLGMLFAALISYLVVLIAGLLLIVTWPFIPLLIVALPIMSLKGGF